MNVLIACSQPSGYMTDCWRSLASEHRLRVVTLAPERSDNTAFDTAILSGLDHIVHQPSESLDPTIDACFAGFRPELSLICGWHIPAFRQLSQSCKRLGSKLVLGVDNIADGSLRQRLGRLLLRPYLRRFEAAFVPGELSRRYMLWQGFDARCIATGLYSFDQRPYQKVADSRRSDVRRFLFVGQLIERKGFGELIEAYARYRAATPDPWPLRICGLGPLRELASGSGIEYREFIQPKDLPGEMLDCNCFLFPSRSDHWGVALAEAAACGMFLICSDQVGAGVDLIATGSNGVLVPSQNAAALAQAMLDVHHGRYDLSTAGAKSRELAADYDASTWGRRLIGLVS